MPPETIPEPPRNPASQTGDMWILGEHRLPCGDSTSHDDVRRLMKGAVLKQYPLAGHLFVFRGRRGHLLKVIWWVGHCRAIGPSDKQGTCMFLKRQERGRFV